MDLEVKKARYRDASSAVVVATMEGLMSWTTSREPVVQSSLTLADQFAEQVIVVADCPIVAQYIQSHCKVPCRVVPPVRGRGLCGAIFSGLLAAQYKSAYILFGNILYSNPNEWVEIFGTQMGLVAKASTEQEGETIRWRPGTKECPGTKEWQMSGDRSSPQFAGFWSCDRDKELSQLTAEVSLTEVLPSHAMLAPAGWRNFGLEGSYEEHLC